MRPAGALPRPGAPSHRARGGPGRRRFARCASLTRELPVGLDGPAVGARQLSRGLIFVIVAVALFMSSVDATIVATALPAIHHSLHASINWAGWTITIYGLGVIVALPTAGRLSDQFGRRLVLLWGVGVFTVASLL